MDGLKNMITGFLEGNRATAVLRIFVGLLFLYSGIFKAVDQENFSAAIMNYEILPDRLIPYAVIIIPYVEMLTGLLLVIGFKIKPASLILILLMIVFTIAIAVNVVRGKNFDCGCFDLRIFGIDENVSVGLVIRDLVFIGILLVIFRDRKRFYSMEGRG